MSPLIFIGTSIVFACAIAFFIALIFDHRAKEIANKQYNCNYWEDECEVLQNNLDDLERELSETEEQLEEAENKAQELRDQLNEKDKEVLKPYNETANLLESLLRNLKAKQEENKEDELEELNAENERLSNENRELKKDANKELENLRIALKDTVDYKESWKKTAESAKREVGCLKKHIEDHTIDLVGYKVDGHTQVPYYLFIDNKYSWNATTVSAEGYIEKLAERNRKNGNDKIKITPLYAARDNLCIFA